MANVTILDQMSTGDVIDRSVRLYRRNFIPLVLIVSVPTLLGYFASVTFLIGYTQLIGNVENPTANPMEGASLALMMVGMLGYPIWFFVLLFTVSGLSRVVSDHIMLGEPVTFRKCFSAAKKRFGDIFVMGLLSLVVIVTLYFLFIFVVLIAALVMGLVTGVVAAAQMPPWVVGTIVTIIVLLVLAVGIFILLYVLARVVFMPQIVMIEGYKAGHAIGRAMKLGGGNWHRVGAIMLFIYFISSSLFFAFLVPAGIILYFFDLLSQEFFLSPAWNVIYTSFSQVSNLLVLPLWVVSFTLLYFDNRVRKEGYDLELLAREVSPGFYWQPGPSSFQPAGPPREVLQTGPLGLSGYGGTVRASVTATPTAQGSELVVEPPATGSIEENGHPPSSIASEYVGQITETVSDDSESQPMPAPARIDLRTCSICGRPLQPRARFCILCGAEAKESV